MSSLKKNKNKSSLRPHAKLKFLSLFHNTDLILRSQNQLQDDCNYTQNHVYFTKSTQKGFSDLKERLRTPEVGISRYTETQQ